MSGFGPGNHLHLIDGSGFIFRAYHALPPLTRKSDGLPVGAVAGFCNMVWKMLQETKGADAPTHVAVIFDKSEQTFRNELYPAYKAQRPPAPEDLRAAVPADPRRDPRLQPALHRDGGLRGRRHHRHLRHAGRGARAGG